MKIKRLAIIIMALVVVLLSGCGSSNSPRSLWDRYIKAMNAKSLDKLAQIYYPKGSDGYYNYMEETDEDAVFSGYTTIKTISFETELDNKNYYAAYINVRIDKDDYIDFNVYFVRNIMEQWEFIGEVKVLSPIPTEIGNRADDNYYNNIVKTEDGYKYKYIYAGTPGVSGPGDYVRIVEPVSNSKKVEIPSEIEGAPVTVIGDYAFFHYRKILSAFTRATSKMEELIIPDTVTRIENHAFYRSVNLKALELPISLQTVGNYAFASCTGLKKLVINVDEEEMYSTPTYITGKDCMLIEGDAIIYVGDKKTYTLNGANATWSVDNNDIAHFTEDGKLEALMPGQITLTATNNVDKTAYSQAVITVRPAADSNNTIEPLEVTFSYEPIFIEGGMRYVFKGDVMRLSVEGQGVEDITWETSNEKVIAIDPHNGRAKALVNDSLAVKLTARSINHPAIFSTITVTVYNTSAKLVFSENALDRLNGLQELYLYAKNPYSIEFKGGLHLNSKVIVYVPEANKESYEIVFPELKNQIKVLPEE